MKHALTLYFRRQPPTHEQRKKRFAAGAVLLLLIGFGCIDPYTPSTTTTDLRILVVDGIFNNADTSRFSLSRSTPIQSTVDSVPELNAEVNIEEEGGAAHRLSGNNAGIYSLLPGQVNTSKNVRIHIILSSGVEYASGYVPVLTTPPIDSISYTATAAGPTPGMQVFVNTHDPANNTHYYRWTYDETWEYYSAFESSLERIDSQIVERKVNISRCWSYGFSSSILVASTTDLSEDRINEFQLNYLNRYNVKISERYSMLVHQFALTKEAYQYWITLKKNTENVGTVFGPLPSRVTGNLTCITNPDIPVLGYFSASSESTMRFMVSRDDLPRHSDYNDGYNDCTVNEQVFVPLANALDPTSDLYLFGVYSGPALIGYQLGPKSCTDCRLHGGSITKPPYWP